MNKKTETGLVEKAKKITHIFLDVDGVMTDGKIIYGESGKELKQFDVKDGVGIKLAQKAGIEFVIITGRTSDSVAQRCRELDIHDVYQGSWEKLTIVNSIMKEKNISLDRIAYMGDDIVDLPVMRRTGLAAAPADGVEEILEICHFVSGKPGGRGAVRELIELILKSQNRWNEVLSNYNR